MVNPMNKTLRRIFYYRVSFC
uniref:Uncharacterized protein n=1 Tax=Arundo donax TaxID=35708 RepID=A0A0A8YA86_ARUDO